MPTRTAKHKDRKRKKTKKVSRGSNGGQILTEQELAQHVSAQYITGRGGVLRESHAKAKRREETTRLKEIDPDFNEHLRNLDRHPALVLNANYQVRRNCKSTHFPNDFRFHLIFCLESIVVQPMSYLPLSMWHWQEVVKAVFSGKVTVVDVYPDVTIRAANLALPLPSVIALNEYVPQFQHRPAFTKRNVFLRDEYRCQYCNNMFHTRDLSLDHVVPRCMGGRLNWYVLDKRLAFRKCHHCHEH
jgi:5-methylcytosine-specific restriction endonuclease McrA